jgi:hypothetical protein
MNMMMKMLGDHRLHQGLKPPSERMLYLDDPRPMLKSAMRCGNVSSVIRRREDLRLLEGTLVEVSGRVKEYRRHEKRRDLDTVLLVNLIVTPTPFGESVFLGHLWFLRRQFKKIGRIPEQNERIKFLGEVYSYRRLGGRSIDRNLFNTVDYGVKPVAFNEDRN